MTAQLHKLNKSRVATSFSRAATTYDACAHLQIAVGEQLWQLRRDGETYSRTMDLGCGTGNFTHYLTACSNQVVAVDLAEGMLRKARQKHSIFESCSTRSLDIHYIAADAESLPFAPNSIDFIFSSLALQWCQQLPELADSLHRVLAQNGQVAIATLGPDTLHELRTAWGKIDKFVHVNRFESEAAFLSPFLMRNFRVDRAYTERRILHYPTLATLLRELKALGVTNANRGQAQGLAGKRQFEQLASAYEAARCDSGLPVTYQVHYVLLRKIEA